VGDIPQRIVLLSTASPVDKGRPVAAGLNKLPEGLSWRPRTSPAKVKLTADQVLLGSRLSAETLDMHKMLLRLANLAADFRFNLPFFREQLT
jgi:hypothetical protein